MNSGKYVYIVIAKITPFFKRYKIGVAKDTRQRLKALNNMSPVPLYLRFRLRCEDPYHVENLVKNEFAEYNAKGEWFDFGSKQVSDVVDFIRDKAIAVY